MTPVLAELILATPNAPSDGEGMTLVSVSPGLGGFVVMFVLVLAVVLLMLDLTRRVRRLQARANVEERAREEQEARDRGEESSLEDDDLD